MDKTHRYLLWISAIYGFLFFISNPTMPIYLDALGIGGRFIGFYLVSGGL